MSGIDIFLGLMLVVGLIKGIRNGFLVELASLVSLLLGIWVAIRFSHLTQSWLEKHGFDNHRWIETLAFVLTLILVIIGTSLLARLLTAVANLTALGIFNTLGGGLFGLLKTLLLLSVLLNLLHKINVGYAVIGKKTFDDAVLYQPVERLAQRVYPTITQWFEVFRSEAYESQK